MTLISNIENVTIIIAYRCFMKVSW